MGYVPNSHILQVTIPANASPGSILQVTDPSTGQPVQVTVPNGVYPGQTINVAVNAPASVAQPQVIYHQPHQAVMGGAPTTVIVREKESRNDDDCLACLAGACLCCACCQLMSFMH